VKRCVAVALATAFFGALVAGPAAAAPNDPHFARQWHFAKVQAEQAWGTTTGTGVLVAVVDSGVDLTHPDLQANIVSYNDADMVEPDGNCTGPAQSRVCTQDGAQDENGHGTHVAGLIGAVANNGVGVAGVAPGAKILPVRSLNENGDGTTEQVAAGIRFAAQKGADVINLSLGIDARGHAVNLVGLLDPIHDAIAFAWAQGATIVIAAGNESTPLCAEPSANPTVVCVGALDQFDNVAWYSNTDASHQNYVVAPGGWSLGALSLGSASPTGATCQGEIFSTYLRSQQSWCSAEAGYEGISGSSMSTPIVSGVAALLASRGYTNQEIVACLKTSATDIGPPGRDPFYGHGRVNALAAVTTC